MAKFANLKVVIGLSKEGLRKLNRDIKTTKGKFRANFGEIAGMAKNAALAIGSALAGAVTALIKASADMQRVEVGFRSIMGGADGAARMVAKLNKFSASTPYQLEEVSQAARQLLAVGVKESAIEKTLRTLGDIAAATGSGITEMSAIYAKAQAKGKIDQEILNMLLDRGINIKGELLKVTGQTNEEFKATSVSVEQFNEAINNMAGAGGFAEGSMQNLSGTIHGLSSTLYDVTKQRLAQFSDESGLSAYFQMRLALAIGSVKEGIKTTKGEVDELSKRFGKLRERALTPTHEEALKVEQGFADLEKELVSAIKHADKGSEEYKRLTSILEGVKDGSVELNEAILAGLPHKSEETEAVKLTKEEFEAQYDAAEKLREEKERLAEATRQVIVTAKDEAAASEGIASLYTAGPTVDLGGFDFVGMDEEVIEEEGEKARAAYGAHLIQIEQDTKERLDSMRVSSEQLATTISNSLGNAFVSIINKSKDAGQAFAGFAAEAIKASLAAAQAHMIEAAIGSGKMSGPAAFFVIPAMVATGMALVDSFFGQIPQMAQGGLFTGESLALVGEGRGTSAINPEVVAPLDKLQGMLGGQSVQVTGTLRGSDIFLSGQRGKVDLVRQSFTGNF